jgi:hypothetical protein
MSPSCLHSRILNCKPENVLFINDRLKILKLGRLPRGISHWLKVSSDLSQTATLVSWFLTVWTEDKLGYWLCQHSAGVSRMGARV